MRHTTPKTKRLLVALALVVLLPCPALLPALLLVLDLLALLVLAPVALLPVRTEATARDLATATPDSTVLRLLVLAPAQAIPQTHMVLLAPVRTAQLRVALAPVLTVKRRTLRVLGLPRVDTLRRRTVDMDDLLRALLVILKDPMDNRPPRRATRCMDLTRCLLCSDDFLYFCHVLFLVITMYKTELTTYTKQYTRST